LYREWIAMPEIVWQTTNATWVMVLWAAYLGGYGIVLVSTFLINHFELFGLSQVFANMMGKAQPQYRFVQPLFYKIIRHPLYLGWLLVFWATPEMSAGHLLLAFGITAQILISIPYEEWDIEDDLGEPYRDYKAKTPMLVPFAKIRD
jgi:protein-S-isoprenylcysteine O-methyltransferase Ste14